MSFGLIAGPAAAQPRNNQDGLVNVNVQLEDTQVLVPVAIGVAANVCGVNAAVIAQQLDQTAEPVCTTSGDVLARGDQRQN